MNGGRPSLNRIGQFSQFPTKINETVSTLNSDGEGKQITWIVGCGMILASVMKTISLTQLLSTCMDACGKGCKVRNSER
jgi:hypothetical protein